MYPNNLTNRIENLLCDVLSYIDFGEILLFNIFRDASGIKLKRTLSNKKN